MKATIHLTHDELCACVAEALTARSGVKVAATDVRLRCEKEDRTGADLFAADAAVDLPKREAAR